MSNFLHHIPCPRCGSRDNRGVYSDGHEWCWGCHDYKPADGLRYTPPKEDVVEQGLSIPTDLTKELPLPCILWLKKYGLTNKEIIDNYYGWSGSRKLLIARVLSSSEQLVMWQGRYFGSEPKHPKYVTKGKVNSLLHIIGNSDTIVLVEDLISAIKVGRQTASMPMWGSGIPSEQLKRLSDRFKYLKVWNDLDKLDQARKTAKIASQFSFERIDVIKTELDPKEYNDTEIKGYLE